MPTQRAAPAPTYCGEPTEKRSPRCSGIGGLCVYDSGDQQDLHQGLLGKLLHGECAACGEGLAEEFGVHLVHGAEEAHVGKENSGFHHIFHRSAGGLEDGLHVGEALTGLSLDVGGHIAGGGVDGKLTRAEKKISGLHSLAVGTDGRRCGRSGYRLFHDMMFYGT